MDKETIKAVIDELRFVEKKLSSYSSLSQDECIDIVKSRIDDFRYFHDVYLSSDK